MLRLSYVNTMRGLEDGLHVADIAVFDLLTCEPDERISEVRQRVGKLDFDNVPVRENGSIVGVVEGIKGFKPNATAGSVRQPLSETMLIAGSVSLRSFLPHINDRPYRLVVDANGIQGVVTPSDVVQLPVRLLVFALLAHLEELMRASIRQKQPDAELAVAGLEPERRKLVRRTLKRQKTKDLNPSPLDVTAFIDKANLLFSLGVLQDNAQDRRLFEEFYELRNKVDHVDRYAQTPKALEGFLGHIRQLEAWIDRLTDGLPTDYPAVGG